MYIFSTYYSHPLKPVYLSFFFCLTVYVHMFVYIMYILIVIITIFIRKIWSIYKSIWKYKYFCNVFKYKYKYLWEKLKVFKYKYKYF